MAAFGRATRANTYVEGYLRWNEYARQLADFHSRYDLFLTPSLAMPPARVGEIRTPDGQQRALLVLLALGLEGLLMTNDLIQQVVQEKLQWWTLNQRTKS